MLNRYVALDLETTGINPRMDEIIEIGMIKVDDGQITDSFHTLVRPDAKIPYRITKITEIDDQMLEGAPRFCQIQDYVAGFIEGEALLGHSVGFDISFLQSSLGRALYNRAFDTMELARIIMPSAKSYRLQDLCVSAGIENTVSHRAMEDARAAMMLYEHLSKSTYRLDGHIRACLEWLLKKAGSAWGAVFQGSAVISPGMVFCPTGRELFARSDHICYESSRGWGYADPDRVRDLISEGGLLNRTMASFQYRHQQVEMAVEVAGAFNEKKFLLVEAGTGTGKSMAYLLPAILWVAAGGPRVVISTGTINLQEQLWQKDIPQITNCLGINIKAVLAKGRPNYVCLRRWQAALSEGPSSDQEAIFYSRVLVWLNETESGDRADLNLNFQEEEFWLDICADSDSCLGNKCGYYSGMCFVFRARREADSSGLIITNHALLLSDIKTGNMVLPPYGPLILDEAHHLEDAATDQLGRQVSWNGVRRWLSSSGRAVARCWELVPQTDSGAWMDCLVSLREGLGRLRSVSEDFFSLVKSFVCRKVTLYEGELLSLRIRSDDFCGNDHGPLWSQYRNFTFELRAVLDGFRKIIDLMQAWAVENDSWGGRLKDIIHLSFAGEELLYNVEFNLSCGDESFVYWISVSRQGEWSFVSINSSPVRIGALLYDRLFSDKESVVMTSATLTVNGSFDFFTERTGIDRIFGARVKKIQIDSPFLYDSQSLLCLVSDLPHQGLEAGGRYIEKISAAVKDLVMAAGGKTLVLFTSHRVLREVYGHVKEGLEENHISVLGHKIDGNRQRLVEEFKRAGRAVLMGASSLWEGIDIPGEDLTCVIIVKLPFSSPSAPVLEARMEELETDGRSSFCDYYLPLAVIRFKQGFGRLIRSERDRGVVVVLDRRILERSYGKYFLGSLPLKEHYKGGIKMVKERVIDWLGENAENIQFY